MNLAQAISRYGIFGALARGPRKARKVVRRAIYRTIRAQVCRTEYGVLMHANWGDKTFEMCLNGSYGTTLSTLLSTRTDPFVFFDVGANQGLYSLIAGRNPHCLQVHSFEPVSSTFALLEKNIEQNGLGSKVTAVKAAISDSDGKVRISLPFGHSGAASIHNDLAEGSELVNTVSFVTIAGQLQHDAVPIVAKVDVEGHELTVLRELARSPLWNRLQAVFYEVDEKWSNAKELEAVLDPSKFTFVQIGSGTHYDVLATRYGAR
jgi:FkbM family methyltransferase